MLLTIDSAGRVLDLFTPATPERGVTEVGLELGISKSKAHTLLASLAQVGLLQRTTGGRYRLGWRLLTLSRVLGNTTDFHRHARPIMRVLSDRFGETVHLATLDRGRVVYVDRVEGAKAALPAESAVGSLLPAHCSAVGKVLLAQLPPVELDAIIDCHGLPCRTESTITDPRALAEQLARVRMRGYAIEREEAVRGIACVAAPIVTSGPRVVAALSITASADRFARHEDAYRRAVVLASRHVSRRLQASACPPDNTIPTALEYAAA